MLFNIETDLCLMDVCLPVESKVVFLQWIIKNERLHQVINVLVGTMIEATHGYSVPVDVIIFSLCNDFPFVLLFHLFYMFLWGC